jgi:hypothetical protein
LLIIRIPWWSVKLLHNWIIPNMLILTLVAVVAVPSQEELTRLHSLLLLGISNQRNFGPKKKKFW